MQSNDEGGSELIKKLVSIRFAVIAISSKPISRQQTKRIAGKAKFCCSGRGVVGELGDREDAVD